MRNFLATISALFLFSLTSVLRANPVEIYGAGWMAGTSGAGTAAVQDWSAAFFNPAGMSHPRLRLEIRNKLKGIEKNSNHDSSSDPHGENGQTAKQNLKIKNLTKKNKVEGAIGHYDAQGSLNASSLAGNGSQKKSFPFPIQMGLGYSQVIPQMGIGLDHSGSEITAKKSKNAQDLEYTGYLQLGLTFDLRHIIDMPYDIPVVFGTVLSTPADGTVSAAPDLNEKSYNFRKVGLNAKVIGAYFGVSIQPWKDRLSFGYSPGGQVVLDGNASVSNISLDKNEPVYVNAIADVNTKPAPIVGALYAQPLPLGEMYFSLVYRSALSLESSFNLKTELPFGIVQDQKIDGLNQILPETVILGLAYAVSHYKFFIDGEYQAWSQIKVNPARASNESDFNFNDIIAIRLGAESRLAQTSILRKIGLTARVGLAHIPAFTPEQTGDANILDNAKTISSFGLSRWIPALGVARHPMMIDFGFSWQHWHERIAKKAASVKLPDGSSQPSYTYGGNIVVLSLSLNWKI